MLVERDDTAVVQGERNRSRSPEQRSKQLVDTVDFVEAGRAALVAARGA